MSWIEFHDNGVAYGALEVNTTYSTSTERYCKIRIVVYGKRADYTGASDGSLSVTASGWDQTGATPSPIVFSGGEWVYLGEWEKWCDTDSSGNASISFTAKVGVRSPSAGWKYSSKTLTSVSCGTPPRLYFSVSYNANGGSGAPSSQTKTKGVNLTLSSTKPSRTGHSFQGWATTSTSTTVSYSAGDTYSDDADITLYAVWKANTYKVTYNANGGSGAPSQQTKTYGVNLTLSSTKPTKEGYTFKQWNTAKDGTGTAYSAGGTYSGNAAVTLYAIWTANQYTIKFNNNGGSGSMSDQTMTYDTAAALKSNIFTKTGYSFMGWSKTSGGSVVYQNGQSVKNLVSTSGGSITLYAVWGINSITITFDAASNGGTTPETSRTINYGSSLSTLPVATKPYYKFVGWFTAKSGGAQISTTTVFTASTTIYAQFVVDSSTSVNVKGTWKKGIPYVNVKGVWKKGYAKVKSGNWKQGIG